MNTQPRHPKCRALPVEPHPDIHFSAMIPRRGVKIKIFLSVVIPVVKTAFVPVSATREKPANAGAARLCGVSPHPIPDTATALPKQARYQLRYTRLLSYFIRLVVFSQSRRATNCATPRYSIKPHYIIAFVGSFVKHFSLWSKLWVGFKNVQILEKQKPANPCAARLCGTFKKWV